VQSRETVFPLSMLADSRTVCTNPPCLAFLELSDCASWQRATESLIGARLIELVLLLDANC
jgi:hypothetical protein